jgi:SPP1 family predicted phage head-tail adaptor
VNAGDMRHRVQVQRQILTPNEFNEQEVSWETVATRWCAIEPLTSRELMAAAQVQANVDHKIRMRYYSGLTPKNRLVQGSRVFNIDGRMNPSEDKRTTEMVVMVREEV